MADEVQIQAQPGGNGNSFNVDLKQRSLGITGPIVIPVLTLLLVAVVGWMRAQDLKDGLHTISANVDKLYVRQDKQQADLQALLLSEANQQREELRTQTTLLHAQQKEYLDRLRDNRDVMNAKLDKQDQHLQEQTDQMRKEHTTIIYNQGKDVSQHLLLDLPVPASPHHRQ